MAESPPDSSKNLSPALTLILPAALLLLILHKILPLLLAIATASGAWKILRRYQHKQQQQVNLDDIFYRLIREHQGRMTALDLAMNAQLPPQQVQQYLDQRAAEFSAQFEVTEQGSIVYYFETVQALSSTSADTKSEEMNPQLPTHQVSLFPIPARKTTALPTELNQSELAQRLNVHPSTIRNWKYKPEFQQWSLQKDPDAIAWQYSAKTRRFYPMI